jgi:hypothetical protein
VEQPAFLALPSAHIAQTATMRILAWCAPSDGQEALVLNVLQATQEQLALHVLLDII